MPPKGRVRAAPRSTRGSAAAAAGEPTEQNQDSTMTTATTEASEDVESTLAIPPPSGRLEGLNNPSTSSRSASRAASGTTAGSPPLLAVGEKPKPKLRFAPKNVARKTKEEREQLNRLYDPPPPDSSLDAFGITRGGASGRGARGRGRGRGGFGRGETKREEPVIASGPFALGSVMTNRGKQKISMERLSRSLRPAGTSSSSKSRIKRESDEAGFIKEDYSSSDSEGGPKVDVEMIDLITDSEDEEGDGEKKHASKGFAPVRIERHEHIDRTAVATTDAKKKTDVKREKGKGKEKDVEIVEERKSRSRRDSGNQQRAKIESESPKATRRTTKSPEQTRKKQKSSSPEDKRRKPKPRSRSRSRKSGIVPQTQEDFEEHDRFELDRFQMLKELGPALPERAPVDAEGDHSMEDAAASKTEALDEKENKLYLFQFPPVLPILEPIETIGDEDIPIKEEDSNVAAAAATVAGSLSSSTPKKEPPSPELRSKSGPTEPKVKKEKETFTTLEDVQRAKLPVGTAGKLQVHRSGKVTIVFGGIEFEVHRGVDCEFLQDIVVLQKESGQMDERGRPKGRAWGMGQLKGKFVVTPDIGKLID